MRNEFAVTDSTGINWLVLMSDTLLYESNHLPAEGQTLSTSRFRALLAVAISDSPTISVISTRPYAKMVAVLQPLFDLYDSECTEAGTAHCMDVAYYDDGVGGTRQVTSVTYNETAENPVYIEIETGAKLRSGNVGEFAQVLAFMDHWDDLDQADLEQFLSERPTPAEGQPTTRIGIVRPDKDGTGYVIRGFKLIAG